MKQVDVNTQRMRTIRRSNTGFWLAAILLIVLIIFPMALCLLIEVRNDPGFSTSLSAWVAFYYLFAMMLSVGPWLVSLYCNIRALSEASRLAPLEREKVIMQSGGMLLAGMLCAILMAFPGGIASWFGLMLEITIALSAIVIPIVRYRIIAR